jgi:hypothetical protein
MSFCVAAFLPWPFGFFFLPVGCWPLCVVQDFLNVMSTAQLRCDTGISPCILDTSPSRVPAPVSNRLLFPVGFSLLAVQARKKGAKYHTKNFSVWRPWLSFS